jgi:hypothetical protein
MVFNDSTIKGIQYTVIGGVLDLPCTSAPVCG